MDKEKRNARQARYMENKERISFVLDKGTKARINSAAAALGVSAGEYIRQAIEEKLTGNGPPVEEIERIPFFE